MKMRFLIVAVFAVLLISAANSAENEKTLKDKGYNSLSVEGTEKTECMEVEFLREEFPGLEEEGSRFIVSVKAEFLPQMEGKASVDIFLNGEHIGRIPQEEFVCESGECWGRVQADKEILRQENKVKFCGRTGKSITRINISNESLLGTYFVPAFGEGDFTKCIFLESGGCVKEYEASLGEDLNVNILIHNRGGGEAFIRFKDKRSIIGEKEERKELADVDFNFLLPAGETRIISYPVRVKEAGPMSLGPSAIYYDNVFGEEQLLFSNTVDLTVRYAEPKAEAFILEKDDEEKKARAKVVVRNDSPYPLHGILVSVVTGSGLEVEGNDRLEIAELRGKGSETLEFNVYARNAGEFSLGCTVEFASGKQAIECGGTRVLFAEKGADPVIVGAALMLVIGVLIYFHLHSREEYG